MAELPRAFVVKVGRRKALAGLAWVPLTSTEPVRVRKEAKERARDLGARHATILQFDGAEYALAGILAHPPARYGMRPSGMPAVAAWFAASCACPTIYIEKLASGQFWVLAASRFDFDLRTDVILTAAKAAELVAEVHDGWVMQGVQPTVVAQSRGDVESLPLPCSVGVGTLTSILEGAPPKQAACRKIVGIPAWVPAAAVAVLVATGASFVGVRVSEQLERGRQSAALAAAEAQRQADAGIAAGEARQRQAAAAQAALDARLATAAPVDAVQACLDGADGLPSMLGGWVLDQVTCEAGKLVATYRSDEAALPTESSFRLAAQDAGLSTSVKWFEKTGAVELPLPASEARAQVLAAELPSQSRVGEDMASYYAAASRTMPGVSGMLAPPKPVQLQPIDGAAPEPNFAEGVFTASGAGTWQIAGAIPNRNYLQVSKITVAGKYGAWTATGTFVTKIES